MTAVPTHFYKIVLVEETAKRGTTEGPSGNISCGAFVMPNEPIDPATPLTDYLVPLQMLESVSGGLERATDARKALLAFYWQ